MSGGKNKIPDIIDDTTTHTCYEKGRFLGMGRFSKFYEIIDFSQNTKYAGKIVSKKLISKQTEKEKLIEEEISIHRTLKHRNILGFHSFFKDNLNVYILLELCRKRSMNELQIRRQTLTEPEVRYYLEQILSGVSYLHHNNIIHRNLKLGNLFLNDELIVKIGDFRLAAKIRYEGELKRTFYGTPNYLVPEILTNKGHSFEVDIWSMGCIMFTLLLGKSPFETSSKSRLLPSISQSSRDMIVLMLQFDPIKRPKIHDLFSHEFMTTGYLPQSLPVSSLTMAPRFNLEKSRVPLIEITSADNIRNTPEQNEMFLTSAQGTVKDSLSLQTFKAEETMDSFKEMLYEVMTAKTASKMERLFSVINNIRNIPEKNEMFLTSAQGTVKDSPSLQSFKAEETMDSLEEMLYEVLTAKTASKMARLGVEMTDPAAQPLYWVSKWIDRSNKYGFGYQLCDKSLGVMFNDTTKLIRLPNGINVHFIDTNGKETYFTVQNYPETLERKMKLLSYFGRCMKKKLIKAAENNVKKSDNISRIPHLQKWFRTTSGGVLMQLNNGTIQIDFTDHTKIIMCPFMNATTYVDEDKSFKTFRFSTLEERGYSKMLGEKMKYAYDKMSVLLENNSNESII